MAEENKNGCSIIGWPAIVAFIICFCLPINLCNRVKKLEEKVYQTDTTNVKQTSQITNGYSLTP